MMETFSPTIVLTVNSFARAKDSDALLPHCRPPAVNRDPFAVYILERRWLS
jgi:hypothetical protein